MASIYYPASASIYTRLVGNTGLAELYINTLPNTVIFLTGSFPYTSSITFIQGADTGSTYPISASWVLISVSSSLAVTASYAIGAGVVPADYIGNAVFS